MAESLYGSICLLFSTLINPFYPSLHKITAFIKHLFDGHTCKTNDILVSIGTFKSNPCKHFLEMSEHFKIISKS